MAQTEEFLGTGRRKRAVARVRLADGSGKVTVNGRDVEEYFTVENQRSLAVEPLETVELNEKTDVRVNVSGGGIAGCRGRIHTFSSPATPYKNRAGVPQSKTKRNSIRTF